MAWRWRRGTYATATTATPATRRLAAGARRPAGHCSATRPPSSSPATPPPPATCPRTCGSRPWHWRSPVHKPGHDPAGNALTALKDLSRRGYKPGWLAADRAYSNAQPDSFHLPLLDLGYRPIWDYRRDQLGIQGSHAGALLVDGTWYCPNIPAPLITAGTSVPLRADRPASAGGCCPTLKI
ncbi:hypothetical protein ACFZCK_22785 [Kitasatospora purpeofusca]|uniref:hypothetical protein n=1 Tax=Kitasatospora purpeofusca TaxID=67352 RepID=UPI0036EC0C67